MIQTLLIVISASVLNWSKILLQNDYVDDHDKRLEFITGYTGDYGIAVITKNKTAFWTDELHYYQAENELSCNWIIFKMDFSRVSHNC